MSKTFKPTQAETGDRVITKLLRIKKPQKEAKVHSGGSERIRTSETLLLTRFRVVRLQPLGHASTVNYIKVIASAPIHNKK